MKTGEDVDALVFCALAEEAEYFRDAVKQFCQVEFVEYPDDESFVSYHATVPAYDNTPLALRLTYAGATGGETTAGQLGAWLQELRPNFVGMTGICAGNPDKTQLGDVIISQHAYNDLAGKLTGNQGEPTLKRQLDVESIAPIIRNRIQNQDFHKRWQEEWKQHGIKRPVSVRHQREWILDCLDISSTISKQQRIRNAPDYDRIVYALQHLPVPNASPNITFLDANKHLTEAACAWVTHARHPRPKGQWPFQDHSVPAILPGAMASVPYVVAHGFFQNVNQLDRNVIAVEMESTAFYHTARNPHRHSNNYLLVKGVCDYAGPDKDDSCRDYAGLAAASFLLHYIRRYAKPSAPIAEPSKLTVPEAPQPASDVFRGWSQGDATTYVPRPEKEKEILDHFTRPMNPARLVTLKGFGGMGKSRLAIACCRRAADLLGVKLRVARLDNTLPSAEALAQEIAAAFGFSTEQATPGGLLIALANQPPTLLLLDNFESVASSEEARALIRDLIQKLPDLRFLVTGREAVQIQALEQKVEIEGLAPSEARTLFQHRAQRVQPSWEPRTPEEHAALTEILELTESIPLALELVASGMDPDMLGNVIAVRNSLRNTPRPAPLQGVLPGTSEARHQSLTHCLDWSYQRLPPEVQAGFMRLGLFADSFSEETTEQACGISNAPALRMSLMQASLLHRDTRYPERYRLLRPTQDYAREKLETAKEADSIQQAFVVYFASLIQANSDINQPAHKAVLDREWRNAFSAANLAAHNDN